MPSRSETSLVPSPPSFLVLTDGSTSSKAALTLGGRLAGLLQAQLTVLGYGLSGAALQRHLQWVAGTLSGTVPALTVRPTAELPDQAVYGELQRQPYDLIVLGSGGFIPPGGVTLIEQLLGLSDAPLLLVPQFQTAVAQALIYTSLDAPAREALGFASLCLGHWQARATVLAVTSAAIYASSRRAQVEQSLAEVADSLTHIGIPTARAIRLGQTSEQILREMKLGQHDLLILSVPDVTPAGPARLNAVASDLIESLSRHPLLLLRTPVELQARHPAGAPSVPAYL